MSTEQDDVADLVQRKYRHGFVTEIDEDRVPPGLDEDVIRLISAKKREPRFLTEWRLKAYRHWLDDGGADVGPRPVFADRLPGDLVLRSAEEQRRCPAEPRRGRPEAAGNVRQTRHTVARARPPSRRRCRRRIRQRLGRNDVQGKARRGRRDFLLILRGRSGPPGACAALSRFGRSLSRQLLRGAKFGCVQRRLLCLRATRRAMPNGVVDVFPHQRGQHRTVRADAGRR